MQDATNLELDLMGEHKVFKDAGHQEPVPNDHKNICVHFVCDVKHDGWHRACLVVDGHLTEVPVESNHSGVVSLRDFRLLVFLAELNGLKLWGTNISSAHLEACTKETVCILASPKFGPLAGHRLIIDNALCGLRTSGQRWHDRHAKCLQAEGFVPCIAEPDVWMCATGDVHEHMAVCVDDLAFALKDPEAFAKTLHEKHGFNLKGTRELSFQLGANFTQAKDGTLCVPPSKCISECLMKCHEKMFGEKPKQTVLLPLETSDHPELDASELLDDCGTQQFQSHIGSLQWILSLGRFDMACAVMSLSSFCVAPRKGHLEQ